MQVYKCFFKIVKKKKLSMMVYISIFLALMILFSSFGRNDETGFKATKINVGIVDHDQSTISKALREFLSKEQKVKLMKNDKKTMQNDLFYRNVEYILILPEGFGESLMNKNKKAEIKNVKVPNSTSGYMIDQQIGKFTKIVRGYLAAGFPEEQAVGMAENTLKSSAGISLEGSKKAGEVSSTAYYFQYLAYILIALITLAVSPVFMAFYKKDIRRRNQCSAATNRSRNLQLALGTLTASLGCWLMFMVLAVVIYHNEIFQSNLPLFLLNSLAFLGVSAGISFLVGLLVTNDDALQGVVNVVSLGSSFLGGVFVPLEFMSKHVLSVSKFLPTYWYIKSNSLIDQLEIMDLSHMWPALQGILIQAGFAAALFAAAMLVSKQKRMA
ncbi:ABC transporter permease [Anaerostipes sp.]|uniref:ABC transporter permease n=1 Tax=Anaerostipes sp. TaxID=1872530 RepID=UPI0025C3DEBE|nr:ABC transporter permease [Anaerostipes sp.]MBS7008304.1 ABC transporter permease [Anaerostipes sp.]